MKNVNEVCVFTDGLRKTVSLKWIPSTTDCCVKRENDLKFVELHNIYM